MESSSKLKFLYIAKAKEKKDIGEVSFNASSDWIKDSKKIFETYCSSGIDSKIDQRNKVKIKESTYSYYFTIIDNGIFYLAIASSSLSETEVFRLFDDISKEYIPLLRDDKGKLNSIGYKKLNEVLKNFQKNESVIDQINNDMNEIKNDLKVNIKDIIVNIDDANHLKEQSEKISDSSKQFQKSAEKAKKMTCFQNFKWWIIIGIAIAVLILIIVVSVVPKGSSSNGNNQSNGNNTST